MIDGKAAVSISLANLPDGLDVGPNQSRRSRKNSPSDDAPSQKSNAKTSAAHNEPSAVPTHSSFHSPGMPSNLLPNPHLSPYAPNQYIHQNLPIHPSHTPSSQSSSPHDLKRKRAQVETAQPVTTSPSMGFYPPSCIASNPQQLVSNAFEIPSNHASQGISTTGLDGTGLFGGHVDTYGFPYYFEY